MNAFEQIKLPRRVNSNRLLLALSEKMNVYDVNRIAIAYLNIWHKENLYSSITPQFFIKQFPELTEGIINSFFPINSIPFNSFFVFTCIFLFYDNELIFSLLLTLSNVCSNKLISIEQIKDFIHLYKLDERLFNYIIVNHQIKSSQNNNDNNNEEEIFPPNTIGLKEFKQICYLDPSFIMSIAALKDSLKSLCFNYDEYDNIHKRFTYYYTNPERASDRCTISSNSLERIPEMSDVESLYNSQSNNNNNNNNKRRKSSKIADENYVYSNDRNTNILLTADATDESCWSRIDRKYIHYKLPPYYYDYGIDNPNYKKLEEVILMARKIYGYSVRLNGTSKHNVTKNVIVCDIFDNNNNS